MLHLDASAHALPHQILRIQKLHMSHMFAMRSPMATCCGDWQSVSRYQIVRSRCRHVMLLDLVHHVSYLQFFGMSHHAPAHHCIKFVIVWLQFFGVLNGIDTAFWCPSKDPHLPAPFNSYAPSGKALCKRFVQLGLGLEETIEKPLMVCSSPTFFISYFEDAAHCNVDSLAARFHATQKKKKEKEKNKRLCAASVALSSS